MAQIEEEKREHQNKMLKMEKEMEDVFERKVREKQQNLKDSQNDLERRPKEWKEKLEQQMRELEARLAAFEQVMFVSILSDGSGIRNLGFGFWKVPWRTS